MTENKNKEKPTKKKSVIVGFFRKFKNAFYAQATVGFFGRKSASFEKVKKLLDNSFIASLIGKRSRFGKAVAKSRLFVAEQFENSLSIHMWRSALRFLVGCRIRLYGAFFASFGLSVLLGYLAKRYVFFESGSDVWRIALAASLILSSLPMMLSRKTLSEAFGESLLGSFISQSTLGISETKFDVSNVKHGNAYNFAVIAGAGVGVLSIFVEPIILFLIPAITAVAAIVLYSPEAGVVMTFISLPFAALFGNDLILIFFISLFSISYLVKLARGKRIVRFEITDLFLILFAFALYCGTLKTDADTVKTFILPVVVVFGCFVVGNLMRTTIWQKRFVSSYVFAASVIAVFHIVELLLRDKWSFVEILGKDGFLTDHLSSSTFMLPALFATLTFAVCSKSVREKIATTLLSLIIVTAIALTDHAFGYLVLIGTFLLFIILKKGTVPVVTVGLFAVPAALTLLPWSVAQALRGAFDLSDVLNHSSSKVFQGTSSMMSRFWFSGIGYGNFSNIYPYFASVGFEKAESLPSTLLKLFENLGILGVTIIFAVFVLFFVNCFGFIRISGANRYKPVVAAGVSSMVCLILKSIFFNTAGDLKILFVMFCVFYITCAAIRNGRHDIEKFKIIEENTEFSASIDI